MCGWVVMDSFKIYTNFSERVEKDCKIQIFHHQCDPKICGLFPIENQYKSIPITVQSGDWHFSRSDCIAQVFLLHSQLVIEAHCARESIEYRFATDSKIFKKYFSYVTQIEPIYRNPVNNCERLARKWEENKKQEVEFSLYSLSFVLIVYCLKLDTQRYVVKECYQCFAPLRKRETSSGSLYRVSYDSFTCIWKVKKYDR